MRSQLLFTFGWAGLWIGALIVTAQAGASAQQAVSAALVVFA